MSATLAFPQPEPTDPDSVADALDIGLVHWVKGETAEALQCLRQASEASDASGNGQRAQALAQAATDLLPKENDGPTLSSPAPSEAQSSEPRRSKLPGPPAPPKKFTGAPEDSISPTAAKQQTARTSVIPVGTSRSQSTVPSVSLQAESAKSSTGTTGPVSARPSPPSTRPAAQVSVVPSPTPGSPSGTSTTQTPDPAAAKTSNGPSIKPEPAKATPATTARAVESARPTSSTSTEAKPRSTSQPTPTQEPRMSPRSDSIEHRLASIRVRIDRIEPDGTIRLRQLDLAATSSGEDNALLVLPQALWQALKHTS